MATVAFALVASAASSALAAAPVGAVPVTQLSRDPYTNLSSYHRTQVEPDSYSFGSTIVATFQAGRFESGGSDDIGWATSKDDGATWTHGFLPGTTVYATPPGPWARISDPAVAYDPRDDVWMIEGLVIDASLRGAGVVAGRSLDGGLTWQNPVSVSTNLPQYDKSWVGCDTSAVSPFYGNCYVEVDDPSAGNLLHLFRSTDGGLSWSESAAPSSSVLGGQPLVQPNGTVVVPIAASGIDSFVSTDGGQSYAGAYSISSSQFHMPAGGVRSGFGLPSAETDGAGTIYVGWADCRFHVGCGANDIVFSTSTDGTTWSAVRRIPAVPTSSADLFIPGFGVDHSTSGASAHLGVAFYFYPNAQCTTDTCKLSVGFVSSTDAGRTWSPAVKVFGPMSLKGLPNTSLGYMVGDYFSTSFGSNGKAYPIFAGATGSSCTQGDISSCHESMFTATNGLVVTGGSLRSVTGPVRSTGGWHIDTPGTAF
jgi:hypothetical protein